jgi:hypothetical protein
LIIADVGEYKKRDKESSPDHLYNFVYFVAFILLILSFFYLIDTAGASFSKYALAACFVISGMCSILLVWYFYPAIKIDKSTVASQLIKVFLAVILASFVQQLFDPPEYWLDGDELFRLAISRGILHRGLPVPIDWFVAGSIGHLKSYSFVEWFAVALYSILVGTISLEVIYVSILPFIIRFTTILLCWSLLDRLNAIKKTKVPLAPRFFQYILAAFIILFGASPYWQALWHSLERQPLLGWLVILLAAVLTADLVLLYEKEADRPRLFLQATLCWLMPAVLIYIKLLFATVLLGGMAIFYFWIFTVYSGKFRLFPPLIGGFAFVIFYLSLSFIAPPGEWILGFFLGKGTSYVLLPGVVEDWRVASFIAFGGICLLLALLCFKKKSRRENTSTVLWLSFPLGVIISGYVPGLFLRYTGDTGGAEAYWLMGGWFGISLLGTTVVLYLTKDRPIFSVITIIYFSASIACSMYLNYDSKYSYKVLEPRIKAAKYMCKKIDERLAFKKQSVPRNYVTVNPWLGKVDFEISAYCSISSMASGSPYGGLNKTEGSSQAKRANSLLISAPDIDQILQEYKGTNRQIDGVFVIRPAGKELKKYEDREIARYEGNILYGPL